MREKWRKIQARENIVTWFFGLCILWFAMWTFVFMGCVIPKIPDQTIEEVKACYIPEPFKKPKLPTVKYTNVFEYSCFVDAEQKANARLREILLIEYANNMTDLYNDARQRCDRGSK